MSKLTVSTLTEDQAEDTRDLFFERTNIDLFQLEPDEIHELLALLPLALVYLHQTYFGGQETEGE